MILSTGLGNVHAEIVGKNEAGGDVYEMHSIPYARAGRFEKPRLIERYDGENCINRKETVCFPQHGTLSG